MQDGSKNFGGQGVRGAADLSGEFGEGFLEPCDGIIHGFDGEDPRLLGGFLLSFFFREPQVKSLSDFRGKMLSDVSKNLPQIPPGFRAVFGGTLP